MTTGRINQVASRKKKVRITRSESPTVEYTPLHKIGESGSYGDGRTPSCEQTTVEERNRSVLEQFRTRNVSTAINATELDNVEIERISCGTYGQKTLFSNTISTLHDYDTRQSRWRTGWESMGTLRHPKGACSRKQTLETH